LINENKEKHIFTIRHCHHQYIRIGSRGLFGNYIWSSFKIYQMRTAILWILMVCFVSTLSSQRSRLGVLNILTFPQEQQFVFDFSSRVVLDSCILQFNRVLPLTVVSKINSDKFLFSDGNRAYNKSCEIVTNGDTLSNKEIYNNYPSFLHVQATPPIIFSFDDSLYYIVSTSGTVPYGVRDSIFYSIVDITADSGRGAVVSKRNLLMTGEFMYGLKCTKHANGRDWWVVGHSYLADTIITFLFTPQGPLLTLKQTIGYYEDWTSGGNIIFNGAFSPNGSHFVHLPNLDTNTIGLLEFDRCTGLFYNYDSVYLANLLPTPEYNVVHPIFSPDGSQVYIMKASGLFQLDFNTHQVHTVSLIDTAIYGPTAYYFTSMFPTPDDKILIGITGLPYFSCINLPNQHGAGLGYTINTYPLPAQFGSVMNYVINHELGAVEGSVCDSLIGINDLGGMALAMSLYPNPASDVINLVLNSSISKEVWVSLINATGQLVNRQRVLFQSGHARLSIKDLSPGLYLIQVGQKSQRVMVE
jgi:hypothetical protein